MSAVRVQVRLRIRVEEHLLKWKLFINSSGSLGSCVWKTSAARRDPIDVSILSRFCRAPPSESNPNMRMFWIYIPKPTIKYSFHCVLWEFTELSRRTLHSARTIKRNVSNVPIANHQVIVIFCLECKLFKFNLFSFCCMHLLPFDVLAGAICPDVRLLFAFDSAKTKANNIRFGYLLTHIHQPMWKHALEASRNQAVDFMHGYVSIHFCNWNISQPALMAARRWLKRSYFACDHYYFF